MLHELTIIHRRKPRSFETSGLESTQVWETCLRSLAFMAGAPNVPVDSTDEVYSGRAAYQFLLEVMSGLHSPIVGETEVFGQFKIFAAGWVQQDSRWASLVQRLLNDAKTLRSLYLSGLGNQSYGSWLRKNLKTNEVHVFGAGQLVGEILPYLQKQSEVTLHARQPKRVNLSAKVEEISAQSFCAGALVVAAPVSAADIRSWLNGRVPQQIFDLRDNSATDPILPGAVSLTQIFGHIEKTRVRLLPVVEQIKAEILIRSQAVALQEKVRPQGWDDLCA